MALKVFLLNCFGRSVLLDCFVNMSYVYKGSRQTVLGKTWGGMCMKD